MDATLETFEGWARYQLFDPARASPEEMEGFSRGFAVILDLRARYRPVGPSAYQLAFESFGGTGLPAFIKAVIASGFPSLAERSTYAQPFLLSPNLK
jgi:hypothetical protein